MIRPVPPRRFAQGLAGALALSIGLGEFLGATVTARVFEGLFVAALTALVFGRFCLGSYLYERVRSRSSISRPRLSHSPNR